MGGWEGGMVPGSEERGYKRCVGRWCCCYGGCFNVINFAMQGGSNLAWFTSASKLHHTESLSVCHLSLTVCLFSSLLSYNSKTIGCILSRLDLLMW